MDQTAQGENQAAATRILRANTDDPRFGDSADPEPVRKQSWTAATAIVSDATTRLMDLPGRHSRGWVRWRSSNPLSTQHSTQLGSFSVNSQVTSVADRRSDQADQSRTRAQTF